MTLIDTIILAAGTSKRFKRNKLKEIYNQKPILVHTINTFLDFSENVTIVTGHHNLNFLTEYIQDNRIRFVPNNQYELGMFSSVMTGVMVTKNDFFLIPGDMPLVKKSTIDTLLSTKGVIRVPTYKGRKGHPIFIAKELIPLLKSEPIDSNLKQFRDRYNVTYIDVTDEGILLDVDYQEDMIKLDTERNE